MSTVTATPTALPAPTAPPIARALPFLASSAAFLRSSLTALASNLIYRPASAFLLPVPIVLYLLAPVLTLAEVALEAFVYAPYGVAAYLCDALRPVYVLVGAACVCGALVGVGGRVLVWVLRAVVLGPGVKAGQQGQQPARDSGAIKMVVGKVSKRTKKKV